MHYLAPTLGLGRDSAEVSPSVGCCPLFSWFQRMSHLCNRPAFPSDLIACLLVTLSTIGKLTVYFQTAFQAGQWVGGGDRQSAAGPANGEPRFCLCCAGWGPVSSSSPWVPCLPLGTWDLGRDEGAARGACREGHLQRRFCATWKVALLKLRAREDSAAAAEGALLETGILPTTNTDQHSPCACHTSSARCALRP